MEVILSTKAKNLINSQFDDDEKANLNYKVSNILINGSKRGCSGFVTNSTTGATVYFTTERCAYVKGFMYRFARNDRDYTGENNRWRNSFAEAVVEIGKMLKTERRVTAC